MIDLKNITVEDRKFYGLYYTPKLLSSFHVSIISNYLSNKTPKILEPGAGKGSYIKAIYKYLDPRKVSVVEPLKQNVEYLSKKFPDINLYGTFYEDINFKKESFDLIIGNPNYILAESHITLSMNYLKEGGILSFLLRLNFLGSQKRKQFWINYKPFRIHSLSTRPKFFGSGTDMTEYALFTWIKGWNGGTDLIITDWKD
jgi:hypothetical protein